MDFISLDGTDLPIDVVTADQLASAIACELYGEDSICPECGSIVIDGKCTQPSKHGGGL